MTVTLETHGCHTNVTWANGENVNPKNIQYTVFRNNADTKNLNTTRYLTTTLPGAPTQHYQVPQHNTTRYPTTTLPGTPTQHYQVPQHNTILWGRVFAVNPCLAVYY